MATVKFHKLPKRRMEKIPLTSADKSWVSDFIGNTRRVRVCHKIGDYEPLTVIYERVDSLYSDSVWGESVGEGRI